MLAKRVVHCCRIADVTKLAAIFKRQNSTINIRVKQGELMGTIDKLQSGKPFASFKGVRYAAPPIGKLRFKAPLPPLRWEGIRPATNHGNICPQFDMASGVKLDGNEDCLFLNIYTPNIDNSTKVPVMVYFHGGGFLSGSGDSDIYGPDYLLEEDVIVVTVNYRLEVLGFLCLDTEDVPGNAGLKDQTAALKWINENIEKFGGDAQNITVFGESAGGASASYHMISPMSQELVHKVISQSGCFLNEWASARHGRERAFKLARVLGKEAKNTDELLDFLQSVPPQQLTKVTRLVMTDEEKSRGLPAHFVPIVEKIFPGQDSFLPKHPKQLLEENKFKHIPTMFGYNDKEGLIILRDTLKKAGDINQNFERRVHRHIVENVSPEEIKNIAEKVRSFYFGDQNMSKETATHIVDLETDYNFLYGIVDLAMTLGRQSKSPTYLYRFSMDGELNLIKMANGVSKYKGACHADDIFYLFKSGKDVENDSEAWKCIKTTVKLWTNFAKYGNPTPPDDSIPVTWLPIQNDVQNILDIGNKLVPGLNPDIHRYIFWKEINDYVECKIRKQASKL